jgi:hypothetical protein
MSLVEIVVQVPCDKPSNSSPTHVYNPQSAAAGCIRHTAVAVVMLVSPGLLETHSAMPGVLLLSAAVGRASPAPT